MYTEESRREDTNNKKGLTMDTWVLWFLIVVLMMTTIGLFLRIHLYKKQLQSFTEQVNSFRKEKRKGLINVESFGKEYIALATGLQQFVDEEQKLIDQSEKDRQSVKNMVAGISHDFRTPLTTAMGYIQLVEKDGNLSEENLDNLRKAYDKTIYLKELSDEFFALSLMENRTKEDYTDISFKKVIENVTLDLYEWVESSGIKFSADMVDDSCIVNAAEVDLTRLLMNLYSNAKKYSKSMLSTELRKTDNEITFSMQNDLEDGTEIDINRVFEPFHREYVGDKGGNGLGLYISKRIVENYGGTIIADIADNMFKVTVVLRAEKKYK